MTIYLSYEITPDEHALVREKLLARKAVLQVGMPTLCDAIIKTAKSVNEDVVFPDGRRGIHADCLTPRDLQNLKDLKRTTLPKLWPIIIYLAVVSDNPGNLPF